MSNIPRVQSHLARLRRGVRRYGVGGSVRRIATIARDCVYDRRTHVWYELPLTGDRSRRELAPGLMLVQATAQHVPMLEALWAIDPAEAYRRLASEGTLWLVLEGETPAFSCWTFVGRTPIRAVAGGWLPLPAGTVCLEESMTAEAFRGRGIAPAAWSAIAERLEAEPFSRLVTAVEEENVASRKAVEKIGFRQIGLMHSSRHGLRTNVTTEASGTAAAFLEDGARQLPTAAAAERRE